MIIQNPQTALYPSMPLSLPPTAVDHVVEMEQIGATMTLPELELNETSDSSGRYLSLSVTGMPVEQGSPELAVITAMDVTEQVQTKFNCKPSLYL